jgi:hypothetical protein
MELNGHTIRAFWGPRRETPKSIANRFLNVIDRLAPIDGVFGDWFSARDDEPVPLEDLRDDMAKIVEDNVARADDGVPTPISGYTVGALNSLDRTPRSISIYVKAGSWSSGPYYGNHAEIESCYGVTLDPAIVTFPIFRAALFVLAEAFDVTWCSAYPNDITGLRRGGSYFRIGWMNYVSPRFAPLITPPKTAIVEYRPNGALFMAATDETFVTANPRHLAVARDIEAAITPLNALPWPPDAEPE